MTDRSRFEQMLEHLINEDQDKAKELFHQLVVEKSRQIYEGILAEDFGIYEIDDEDEKEDEIEDGDIGGDATDDFIDDVDADSEGEGDFGGEGEFGGEGDFGGEEDEGSLEDRVIDLEDALDELRAEFEELMSGEEGEDHESDFDSESGEGEENDEGEFGGSDFGDEEDEGEEELKDSFMREYVEKVGGGSNYTQFSKPGDDGQNTKSVLAKPASSMTGHGKAVNFSGESSSGGTKGGLLAPSTKEENFGNVNVPGGNAGKTGFKTKQPGHGAEKKGSGESAENKKSIIGGKK